MALKLYYAGTTQISFANFLANTINTEFGAGHASVSSGNVNITDVLGYTTKTITLYQGTSRADTSNTVIAIDSANNFLSMIPSSLATTSPVMTAKFRCLIYKDELNTVRLFDNAECVNAPFSLPAVGSTIAYSNVMQKLNGASSPSNVYLTKLFIGNAVLPDLLFVANTVCVNGQEIESTDNNTKFVCIGEDIFYKIGA